MCPTFSLLAGFNSSEEQHWRSFLYQFPSAAFSFSSGEKAGGQQHISSLVAISSDQ
jgi:hypothetical protein